MFVIKLLRNINNITKVSFWVHDNLNVNCIVNKYSEFYYE